MDIKGVAAALVVGGLVGAGGHVWIQEREKQNEADGMRIVVMSLDATVPIDQAIAIALDRFPGLVREAQLEPQDNRAVWAIEVVTAERRLMSVKIDADTGSVLGTGERTASEFFQQDSKKQHLAAGTR